jgi:hypothetical protein
MRHFSTSTAATHDNRSKSERTVTGVGNRSLSIPPMGTGFPDFSDFASDGRCEGCGCAEAAGQFAEFHQQLFHQRVWRHR